MAYSPAVGGAAGAFIAGLSEGIPLAREMGRQRTARAMREANAILAEAEGTDFSSDTMVPGEQALEEPGQTRTYDPAPVNDFAERYRQAVVNIDDPAAYGQAMTNYNDFYSRKVNGLLTTALMADGAGDYATAQRAFGEATKWADPTSSSEVMRKPNGAYVAVNYKNGKPSGGYAATRENMENLLALSTGKPQDWFGLMNQRSADAARWANYAQNVKESNTRSALASAKELRAIQKHEAEMVEQGMKNRTAQIQLGDLEKYHAGDSYNKAFSLHADAVTSGVAADVAVATEESTIAATQAENAAKERTALAPVVDEAIEELGNWTEMTPPAPDIAPEAEGKMADISGMAASTDSEGNKHYYDPFWAYTNQQGYVLPDPQKATAAASLINDMYHVDYADNGSFNIPKQLAAGITEGAIGRSQLTQLQMDDDGEGGAYWSLVSPSLDQVEITEKGAMALAKYRIDANEELMAVQTTDEGRARVEANYQQALDMAGLGGPGPQVAAAPEQGAGPAQFPLTGIPGGAAAAPGAPAGAAAAAAPGMPAAPAAEGVPTDGMPAGFTPPTMQEAIGQTSDPFARYPQTPAGPVQQGLDPFARYDTPPGRTTDDTAARIVPEGPRNPLGNREPVIQNNPGLSTAVQTWIAADAPQDGPVAAAVTKELRKLTPRDRDTALRELQLLQEARQRMRAQ